MNIFDIEEESQVNESEKVDPESELGGRDTLSRIHAHSFLKKGYSSLVFYLMNSEGDRLKDQAPKKMIDVWGVRARNLFYDQNFSTLFLQVRFARQYWGEGEEDKGGDMD